MDIFTGKRPHHRAKQPRNLLINTKTKTVSLIDNVGGDQAEGFDSNGDGRGRVQRWRRPGRRAAGPRRSSDVISRAATWNIITMQGLPIRIKQATARRSRCSTTSSRAAASTGGKNSALKQRPDRSAQGRERQDGQGQWPSTSPKIEQRLQHRARRRPGGDLGQRTACCPAAWQVSDR